ncbi:DUF6011 domain-containing protein [Halalkalibacter oceani]|uniref:DUF6011 domain-containing protein n=1 Tax=Halalkalibacter oceani TaxID=1653776 RepID=UPI0033917952
MIQTTTACIRCGRPLKSIESQQRGYGPTCARKVKEAPDLIDLLLAQTATQDDQNFMDELKERRQRVI